jgi:PAS domain S-box-containing protein
MKINDSHDRRPFDRTIITLGFWLAIVISVVIAAILYLSVVRLIQDRDRITHTYRVLGSLESVLSALRTVEATQRTYLIIGSDNVLNAYQAAYDVLPTEIANLRQLIADNADQQRRLDELMPLVSGRLDFLKEGIRLRQQQGFEAARAFILTDSGQPAIGQIRDRVMAMEGDENTLLAQRNEESRSSVLGAIVAFSGGAAVSFALIATVFYLLNREVASHARAEEALTAERNLLRTLMDTLPDSVFVKDTQSRFILNNVAHRAILGKATLAEVVGKTDFDLFPPELATQYYEDEQQVVRSGEPLLNREEPTVDAAGHRLWYLTTKVPLRDGQGKIIGTLGICHDITERKRSEESIRTLNQDLEKRAVALEAANKELEAFSYSVSHDLRAPLRAIDGFSRILVEEYAAQLDAQAARYLQKVRDNAQRMGLLIDDLLAFSRLGRQALRIQSVAVAEVVAQALNDLSAEQDSRQIDFVIGDLPVCRADPTLLKQVYINLISNALKYTRKCERARIEIGFRDQDGEPIYFVKDNGVGFDMQYASKLFGVFQRLHSAQEYEGTGVGLAIVQRIVNRHNGRVWAEGKVDQGATFFFTLGSNSHV